jgi:nucleotide-binding universal stress UspA family protein
MPTQEKSLELAPRSLLVAYDFSEAAQKALRHGLVIARHYGAKFYLAHVVSSLGYNIAGAESLRLASEKTARAAKELEAGLQNSGALAGLEYEFLLREGDVWEQLEKIIEKKHVNVIVVGTHGRGTLGKLILGSVAERIFRQANCIVVTVGPGAQVESLIERRQNVRPFLLATDFSTDSLRALPHAVSFAKHFDAKLVVLNVLPAAPIPEGFHWSKTGDLAEMRAQARKESEKLFEELVLRQVPKDTKIEFLVKYGLSGEQILQASHELKADLILLGLRLHAHVPTASHTPWEIAYKIVCTANCPVLTIRS